MKKTLAILISLFILSGCGYKLGTMTIGGIKTLSIAPVINNTGKTFIEESFVSATLIREFNRDGTIKIIKEDSIADATMELKLKDFIQEAQAFSNNDVGTAFRIILNAEIIITDNNDDKLYSGIIQGEAFYDVGTDQSEIERITTRQAIEDLTTEIVRTAIDGGW